MANKLPWFTHDHDAHEDLWIRNIVRKQGHVAGWLWWVLLELFHKHGVGDVLKIDISDVSKAGLTSNSVVTRVLTEMATEFQGQSRVSWVLDGTELRLEIKKFRERQAKLKSKTLLECSKTPLEGEREGDGEKHKTPLPPTGVSADAFTPTATATETALRTRKEREAEATASFPAFWALCPRKVGKEKAFKSWLKLNPDTALQSQIHKAMRIQSQTPGWRKDGGQFIPHPATWLNGRLWEDEVSSGTDLEGDRMRAATKSHLLEMGEHFSEPQ